MEKFQIFHTQPLIMFVNTKTQNYVSKKIARIPNVSMKTMNVQIVSVMHKKIAMAFVDVRKISLV